MRFLKLTSTTNIDQSRMRPLIICSIKINMKHDISRDPGQDNTARQSKTVSMHFYFCFVWRIFIAPAF